ncbi:hypothetical protein VaNZ11_009231 [Volvox africanus]|uniref:BZIP domain-containing protein n=1 Tax=Volvox africanus TaxID=51714 RepID=A0ABQ5S7J7_9CHLO|nr:hypothetical protein VaNZ11_009231 [Volvox africanus]
MKMEGSPGEIGQAFAMSEAASAEAHLDDHFSDDEPETELEALQNLPPEERRKALRRLRNRESARRVRARRLAEMSQMGSTLQNLQDENAALKAHVNKLQSHIQSMTLKVYEVTAKYESAVAENAKLRTELLRGRRPSAPGDSSFMAIAAAAANGSNSAPLNQLSPFINPMELTPRGQVLGLSPGHMQLRSTSPMDLQQQRQAVEEVVMLLKEHKRRNHGVGPDRSGGSDMGSNAGGNNTVHSPNSDTALTGPVGGTQVSGLGASALGTNNSSNNNVLPYNIGNISRFKEETDVMGACGLGSGGRAGAGAVGIGIGRSGFPEMCVGSIQQQQQQQQQQLMAHLAGGGGEVMGGGAGLCSSMCLSNTPNVGQPNSLQTLTQPQPLSRMLPALLPTGPVSSGPASSGPMSSGPLPKLHLPLPCESQPQHLQQPQGSQTLGQSHSHSLMQLPASYNYHQVSLNGYQQPMQSSVGIGVCAGGGNGGDVGQQTVSSMVPYGSMSSLSLSAPFYSAVSSLPGAGAGVVGGGGHLPFAGPSSGPNARGSGACGLGGGLGATGLGCGQHHSASWAQDRGTSATSAQNVVAVHPGWQANGPAAGAGAGAGVVIGGGAASGLGLPLRPDDLTDDLLMSLDEYTPEDL